MAHPGPPLESPLDGSVGNEQRQGITLSTCDWKRFNPTAGPSVQVTMKTVSQRFSTTAGFKPVRYFFKIGPRTFREPRAIADRVNF